jgi:hypothetical protein
MGALPPRLPASVRRSASLAKCSALLKGDGSQVNGLRKRCCEGGMFLYWSIVPTETGLSVLHAWEQKESREAQ